MEFQEEFPNSHEGAPGSHLYEFSAGVASSSSAQKKFVEEMKKE